MTSLPSFFCEIIQQLQCGPSMTSWVNLCPFIESIHHSSLLSVFGLSATSTYDSYLPLILGIFGMIWGHLWNVRKGRFRGHGGRRGQTASKSKTTKILKQNLQKLDEIQNLASATSKMTSWPQWPRKWLNEFFQKIHFFKSVHQAEKNEL